MKDIVLNGRTAEPAELYKRLQSGKDVLNMEKPNQAVEAATKCSSNVNGKNIQKIHRTVSRNRRLA